MFSEILCKRENYSGLISSTRQQFSAAYFVRTRYDRRRAATK